MSADGGKVGARRTLYVQPAWTTSCAIRGSRSIVAFRMLRVVRQDGAIEKHSVIAVRAKKRLAVSEPFH